MNRFATMNGVNAARAAAPVAQSRPQPMSGGMQGTNMTPNDPNYQPSYGNALPGTTAAQPPPGPPPPPPGAGAHLAGNINGGMMGTRPNVDLRQVGADPAGPVPQGAPPPGFDPNDPNNAALAGYMAR